MDGPNRANPPNRTFEELHRAIRVLTGRPASDRQRQQFQLYLDLLVRWNRVQRLTGLRSSDDIVRQLFLDSLLFLPCLPAGELAVADIGAGAGIPGIPLAIVRPEISVTLIESKRKRASFLRAVQRELLVQNLNVIEGRAGDMTAELELEGVFDVVVSRAVGAPPELLPIAMRYLKTGGLFVASGPPIEPPMMKGELTTCITPHTVTVPEVEARRVFMIAQKKGLDQTEH